MDVREVIRQTPGTREFDAGRPVSADAVFRALDTARFAGSGGNRQPWRVVAVRDATARRAVGDLYARAWDAYALDRFGTGTSPSTPGARRTSTSFAHGFGTVPLMLTVWVVPDDIEVTDGMEEPPSIVAGGSVFPFVQNLVLSLRAEGLGSRVTTLLAGVQDDLRTLMSVPTDWRLAAVIATGHPRAWPSRLRRNPVESFATWDSYAGDPIQSTPETTVNGP